MVLEKTLESPLDNKEIQPVNPKGDQSWVFIGRTHAEASILWDLMRRNDSFEKTLMLGKIESKKRRGRQRMRWLDGITNSNEFEQTPGDSEEQESLACCSLWGSQRVRHDLMTEQQQTIDNTGLCVLKNIFIFLI